MSLPTKATLSIFPPPPFSSSLQTFACSFSCCRYRNFFLQASAFHSAHPTPLPVVVANGGGVGDPTPLSFLLSKAGPPPLSIATYTHMGKASWERVLSLSLHPAAACNAFWGVRTYHTTERACWVKAGGERRKVSFVFCSPL